MKLFDSHCHPQFPHYESDRDQTLKRALDEGVFMICVGTDYQTSLKAVELAQKYEGIWATAGLHPNDAEVLSIKNYELRDYKELLKNQKVIAVGEVGLDYYRTPESGKQKIQKDVFKKFLDLAVEYDKPVVLHSRDAGKGSTGRVHKDMIEIIRNYRLRGVAHSFTGNAEEAEKYLELGFYLGFNGIITFANQYDETVKYAPLEKILLETDAPYLAPPPFRGKRNEPLYVKYVAKRIAELKGIGYDTVAKQTFENAKKLFRISK